MNASRAERAIASSSPPIAVIEGDGRVKASRSFAPVTRRQPPSYQDPPGSRVLLGGSWPSWATPRLGEQLAASIGSTKQAEVSKKAATTCK